MYASDTLKCVMYVLKASYLLNHILLDTLMFWLKIRVPRDTCSLAIFLFLNWQINLKTLS